MKISPEKRPASTCNDECALQLKNVSHRYGVHAVLQNVDLTVKRGEWLAIVGPSGCGKTTLLNLMSGAEHPTSGAIERYGHFRTVYQSDGLLPWLSASQNIALGLRHLEKSAQEKETERLMNWLGLHGFQSHYPHQLSGGMKQRVEIARALAGETDVLLLDEPFSALDYLTRLRLRRELAEILGQPNAPDATRRTIVLVTHDIEEAAQLADRILVLQADSAGSPAHIACEVCIDAAPPRSATQSEVVDAVRQILAALGIENPGETL